jgi:GNAT superfamily N-acetyltransferase
MRGSLTSLPPPSPLSGPSEISEPAAPEDPLADIPELHSYMARDETDKTAALKLVADSVAQMRQAANRALIFHPLNLALTVGVMTFVARWVYDAKRDWSLVGTSCAGVVMAMLAGYRWCTQGYLHSAETINWDWIEGSDVIVTKFGDEIIGAVVVDWISGESSRQKRKKAWRGEIRAWTVRLKYRGKGVGAALLEDAVKEARKKSAESLEFADDHASEFYCIEVYFYIKLTRHSQTPPEYCQRSTTLNSTDGRGSHANCCKTCWRRVPPEARRDRSITHIPSKGFWNLVIL